MKIEFFKINALSHKITITRTNSTSASAVLNTETYFLHDICHYFVEEQLHYKKGFWGLLAAGYAFTELNGKENLQTEELRFIEKIVGPIQSIVSGHLSQEHFESSTAYLNASITKNMSPAAIAENIKAFLAKWKTVKYGQSLELWFETDPD